MLDRQRPQQLAGLTVEQNDPLVALVWTNKTQPSSNNATTKSVVGHSLQRKQHTNTNLKRTALTRTRPDRTGTETAGSCRPRRIAAAIASAAPRRAQTSGPCGC